MKRIKIITLIAVVFFLVVIFIGCFTIYDNKNKIQESGKSKAENHCIFLFLHNLKEIGENEDVISIYNEDGELLEKIEVDKKSDRVYKIQYNDLKYKEKLTVKSEYFNYEGKSVSIYEYDLDAYGTGEEGMSRAQRRSMNISVDIYYGKLFYNGQERIESQWGGESEYETWLDGFVDVEICFENVEGQEIDEEYLSDDGKVRVILKNEYGWVCPMFIDKNNTVVEEVFRTEWKYILSVFDQDYELPREWDTPRNFRVIIDVENKNVRFEELE